MGLLKDLVLKMGFALNVDVKIQKMNVFRRE